MDGALDHALRTDLALTEVALAFGRTPVLRGVTLSVHPGEVLCLLGPSGCGKSTTLRVAAGLERPQSGEVRLGGRVLTGPGVFVAPEHRGVGFLFQDFALFPHLTVAQNIAFGLRDRPAALRRARVAELLAQVHMTSFAEAWPHTLSGGQQQRVALARALAPEPRVMLLDEPFSGLDADLRRQVRAETASVLRAAGVTTVIVTHDAEEALDLADRIAVMRAGTIEQDGAPAVLRDTPATPYVASVLGEVNSLTLPVEAGIARLGSARIPAPVAGRHSRVLIRPEAIHVGGACCAGAPAGSTLNAVVSAVHLLPRGIAIDLLVPSSDDEPAAPPRPLRAFSLSAPDLRPGQRVQARLDPTLVHVFPADG